MSSLHQDAEYWLLDSGASVTVLSESCAAIYGVEASQRTLGGDAFSSANGTPVRMFQSVHIVVSLLLESEAGETQWVEAGMEVLVGETRHNIISTTSLCLKGWQFLQTREGLSVKAPNGCCAKEVSLFGNVRWIRLHPCGHKQPEQTSGDFEACVGTAMSVLSPLTSKTTEAELAKHRMQGHTPYHPACKHCQVSHTVYQHRKKARGRIESEVVADFFFLSFTGEERVSVRRDNLRVLILVERMSSMVGAVLTTESVIRARHEIIMWLREFGLVSGSTSVLLSTDSESAVSDLVGTAASEFTFSVRKAGPQQHEAVGAAERAVRKVKEALQTLRSDLNAEGLDVCFSPTGFSAALFCICGSLNRFARAHDSDMSPSDMVVGRPSPTGPYTLFGATVLAELPQSVRDLAPNVPRFAESGFLFPALGSQAIRVRASIRIERRLEVRTFLASAVKTCVPLTWKLELLEGIGRQGPAFKQRRAS